MATDKQKFELKGYADGWITEKKGTDVPVFLKFAYIVIAGGCIAYFLMFMNGEVDHSDRGSLVRHFNQMTQSSDGFMYVITASAAVFAVIVVINAFKKPHE
jgi:SNF family Na+-dependent transporter